eukprot:SAG31_NODE_2814_length_5047_cov_3.149555_1_plen_166_part_00
MQPGPAPDRESHRTTTGGPRLAAATPAMVYGSGGAHDHDPTAAATATRSHAHRVRTAVAVLAAVALSTLAYAAVALSTSALNSSVPRASSYGKMSTADATGDGTAEVRLAETQKYVPPTPFPKPKNPHLMIELDPSKDPDIFKGADHTGVECHLFSLNDGCTSPY